MPEHQGLLVSDSFRAHLTEAVKDLIDRQNIDVAVIPGGLTPVLQPLDKCFNKPFKAKVSVSTKPAGWLTARLPTRLPERSERPVKRWCCGGSIENGERSQLTW